MERATWVGMPCPSSLAVTNCGLGLALLKKALPPDLQAGSRLGAIVAGELHKVLYDLAVQARNAGTLESRLKITPSTNRELDPKYSRKGERSAARPDFVLIGIFDSEESSSAGHAATIAANLTPTHGHGRSI